MAITGEVRVSDLLTEFLTDTLILLSTLQAAGAIAAGTLESVFYSLYYFLIFIEPHCHDNTSFRIYYTIFSPSVKATFSLPFSVK